MPDFSRRAIEQEEMMDDLSTGGEQLDRSLYALAVVNRWLGGNSSSWSALQPLVDERKPVRMLDLGTGLADLPVQMVRNADEYGNDVQVVALDLNPNVVLTARDYVRQNLPPYLHSHVDVRQGDALNLPYADDEFDVAHAALFLHHLGTHDGVQLLREMQRVARRGIIVNDLHRHPLAYYAIVVISRVGRAPEMFSHDGPLSVRRGFKKNELQRLADFAGIHDFTISWRWAFRWVLSSVR